MATNSLLPTQIGNVPPGIDSNGFYQGSKVVIGKDPDPAVGFQAVGFGPNGQPEIVQDIVINLSEYTSNPALALAKIQFNTDDIAEIQFLNANAPAKFIFTLKEVSICEDGTEKRMMVLASQTYSP